MRCAGCLAVMLINASERPITISTCATNQPSLSGCAGSYANVSPGQAATFLGDQREYVVVESTGPYACFTFSKDGQEGFIRTFGADSNVTFGPVK
jgi:hypothetical protein